MKSKYKFVPLRLQIENSSNATIQVICHLTKKKMKWNEAARAGWVSDCNGIPFDSYYCPEAVAQLKQNEKVQKEFDKMDFEEDGDQSWDGHKGDY